MLMDTAFNNLFSIAAKLAIFAIEIEKFYLCDSCDPCVNHLLGGNRFVARIARAARAARIAMIARHKFERSFHAGLLSSLQ